MDNSKRCGCERSGNTSGVIKNMAHDQVKLYVTYSLREGGDE